MKNQISERNFRKDEKYENFEDQKQTCYFPSDSASDDHIGLWQYQCLRRGLYINDISDVSDAVSLESAVTVADSTIYVESGTYILDEGLTIAENVKIIGSSTGTVVFDFGEYVKSSQAALYITNSGISFENIIFQNSLDEDSTYGSKKPVIKIETTDITLTNCTILNYTLASALVIHGSTGIVLSGCTISNKNTTNSASSNGYAVIQVNSKSAVSIYSGSINSSIEYQPHISFEYDADKSYYGSEYASTLTVDSYVTFSGVYEGYSAIYSAAPSEIERDDQVYIIPEGSSTAVLLNKQTSETKEGLTTDSTGWYSYNAEMWYYKLLGFIPVYLDGYVYTNTSSGSTVIETIASSLVF